MNCNLNRIRRSKNAALISASSWLPCHPAVKGQRPKGGGRIEILPALTGRVIVPVPVIAELEGGRVLRNPNSGKP